MLKMIIIITSILFFLNIILLIPIRVKIGKRMTEEPYLEIRIFNTLIKKMKVVKNNNLNVPKISVWKVLSSYNLNEGLKVQKENSFLFYLILEYATVTKVTFIPVTNSNNPTLFTLLGFSGWFSVATIKRYIESTFKYVDDDYYQVIIGKNNLGLLFELELTLTLFKFLIAMCKKFKLFLKTIKMGV